MTYNDTNGQRTVTNALGETDTYKFTTLQGVPKVTEIDRAATSTTAAGVETFTYDANGYRASVTDWNGEVTTYVNDLHGQPTTMVEASGTAQARTTTTTYQANWHLPTTIVKPGVTIGFTYDTTGEMLTRTLTDTTTTTVPYSTSGQARVWTYTWGSALLASVKEPVASTTTSFTYSYGALTKITDALSHATQITAHTTGGLPLTVVDPNGVSTALAWDPRQRLLSSAVTTSAGVLTTSYTYDNAGNLTKKTLPDGSALSYGYDAAHRLTGITDLLGGSVALTLDANGDVTQSLVKQATTTQYSHAATFDALGRRLKSTSGATAKSTAWVYDADGNATSVTDPNSHVTGQAFDALNRAKTLTDPATYNVTVTYDSNDNPLTVTDENGHTTSYVYDGFGEMIQQISPDSGATVYHYDGDGNLTQSVDASANTVNRTYDVLDRPLTVTYPADATENVASPGTRPATATASAA